MGERPIVVCTDDDPDWLSHRAQLITASEISILFQDTKWKTRDDLVREKRTGESDFEPTHKTWWGQHMEVPIMRAYGKIVGAPVRPLNALFRHPTLPLGATIDGLTRRPRPRNEVSDHPAWTHERDGRRYPSPYLSNFYDELEEYSDAVTGTGLIEIKNTYGWKIKPRWVEDIPSYYWAQVQAQLWVTGYKWAVICPKVGYCDIVPRLVLPSEKFRVEATRLVKEFWDDVRN